MSTDEDFSKCTVFGTEVNHDLNSVVGKRLNNEYQRNRIMRLNLDNTQLTGCSHDVFEFPQNEDGGNLYDDFEFTKKITGLTPEEFKLFQGNKDENTNIISGLISPLVRTTNNSNESSTRINDGATCKKIQKNYYNNYFYHLFDNIYPAYDGKNIYLVIDTGDDLVKKLGQSLQNPPNNENYNVHVIHSMVTIADSAPKTKPDSKNYRNHYLHLNQYSWLYNVPLEIPFNNEVFMSNYQIINEFNATNFDWKIRQTWTLPRNQSPSYTYITRDAHVDNNKTTVIKEIKEIQNRGNPPTTLNDINNINLAFQKKRSGDHLQIFIAKELPVLLHNSDVNRFDKIRSNTQTDHILTGKDVEYYQNNLFFVTGDWPAFSYAIYNRINSIIMIRTPNMETSFTLVVMFNR